MKSKLLFAAAAMACLMGGASVHAATVFADVTGANTAFESATPSAGGSFIGNGKSMFSYLAPAGLPTNLLSMLTFSSSTTDTTVTTVAAGVTTYTLAGFGGSFKDIYEGATKVVDGVLLTHNVSVLLSGDITDGIITVSKQGATLFPGTFAGSISNYVSAYPIGFVDGGFDLTLTPRSPTGSGWHLDKYGNLETFSATAAGFFSAVPEPATWGVMLLGLVGLGAALRTGRRMAPVAPA
jgi:hypothetical protein